MMHKFGAQYKFLYTRLQVRKNVSGDTVRWWKNEKIDHQNFKIRIDTFALKK